MAELGALSLRIQAEGGEAVLRQVRAIDTEAKKAGVSADVAAQALTKLGISARATGNQVQVAGGHVQAATAILKSMGATATVVASQTDQLAASVAKMRERAAVAFAKEKAESLEGIAAIERRIQLLSRGATIDATRADSVQRLITVEAALTNTLRRGNTTAEQRVVLNNALRAAQAGIASGTVAITQAITKERAAQQTVAQARQAAATAAARERAASLTGITAIERRIGLLTQGVRIDATRADAVRRLITIEEALTKALQRGNVTAEQRIILNQALARTQAGIAAGTSQLLGAIDRSAFATRRATAATAAQVGGLTLFGRAVTTTSGRLSGFSTRAIGGLNAAAFAMSSFAATGTTSLRSLASSAAGFLAFFGPKGAIASIGITAGLGIADFFTRTRKEIDATKDKAIEALKEVSAAVEAGRRSRDPASIVAKLADDTRELQELTVEQAAIEHRTEAARTQAERDRLVVIKARIAALEQEIEVGERAAVSQREVARTGTLTTVTVKGSGKTAAELDRERRDALLKTADALATLHGLDRQTGAQLVELTRLYADLNAELRRGNLTREEQARIEGALAKLRQTEIQSVEFGRTGASRQGPAQRIEINPIAQQRLDAPIKPQVQALNLELQQELAQGLASAISGGITQGFAQGLAEGGLEGGFKAMIGSISSGFGAVFASIGQRVIAGSVLIEKAVAALNALNPIAAIAAGIALTVLGQTLGGGRRGGFSGGGLALAGGASTGPLTASRLIVDPNARLHNVGPQLPRLNASGLATPAQPQVIQVIGIHTPKGQELIGLANQQYQRRGG